MAERDILLKRFAGGDTWDVLYPKTKVNNVDGLYNRLKDSPYYVEGTGTTSGTWLGTIEGLTSYYDGLMINYKIPVAGASTTTLNINGLGAKTVRRTASASVTTHLPVNSIMPLVYTTINGVGYFLWADYDSTRSEISQANIINKTSSTISAISGRRLEYFLTNTTNARAVGWDNKANASHNHTIAQVTDLQAQLTDLQAQLNSKSGTGHTHTIAQVTGLQAALNSKSGTGHTHSAATQSAAGFLSAADKTRLDVLHSLLEEDTSNNVVDSINEVLAVFNNYPEGADLVTALAGKVDKVSGKGLSKNDFTDDYKNKLAGIDTGAQKNVATNLGIARSGTTNTITSSTGDNTIITGATYTQAGLVTTGEQTWNGTKTFSSIPVLPTTTPSNVNHAVSKGYVDGKTNGIMKQVSWNASTGTMVVEVN